LSYGPADSASSIGDLMAPYKPRIRPRLSRNVRPFSNGRGRKHRSSSPERRVILGRAIATVRRLAESP